MAKKPSWPWVPHAHKVQLQIQPSINYKICWPLVPCAPIFKKTHMSLPHTLKPCHHSSMQQKSSSQNPTIKYRELARKFYKKCFKPRCKWKILRVLLPICHVSQAKWKSNTKHSHLNGDSRQQCKEKGKTKKETFLESKQASFVLAQKW